MLPSQLAAFGPIVIACSSKAYSCGHALHEHVIVFASKLWLGSGHCSLGIFRDQAVFASEGSLFWIEIALMVAISVRFARGASKLRSFLNLVKTEDARAQGGKLPADLE